ncbi:glycoside hydrolase [Stereum hirsutum FP-91666 SS1]|uniref:glycoside hydrolase n=1 Tax=Stereum hirsutum (strain FP-91666) TaxID=721885 RepID=UPI0004409DD7|nr:glycoside hydrolase [Stereum hirsutum FP-91666 SS1]EIM90943.1 glycoside hydrolase [Stereum hirsutum FP-91666 SS1]
MWRPCEQPLLSLLCGIWLLSLCSRVASQKCQLRLKAPSTPSNQASTSSGATSTTPSGTPTQTGSSTGSSSASPTLPAFQYGSTPIRAVNLGGWFVLEPWITPSIFENTNNSDIVDEYTMGQLLDTDTALSLLQPHWDTWITEQDFKDISAAGLTHVRLPVGYWSVPTNESVAPYNAGAWPYLLRALSWARNNGVRVMIDLHGAPGSQNGYDNSGQRTSSPVWGLNQANITRTLNVLNTIASEIGHQVDVIELLNEVAGFDGSQWVSAVTSFWQDGYDVVRNATGSSVKVMIGDAFLGVDSWEDFLTYPSAQGVIMDYHEYQIFSDAELSRTQDEHISFACTLLPTLQSFADSNIWTITGEWSTAITDCAQWLNGRGVGSRWDGTFGDGNPAFGSCDNFTGSWTTFSSSYKTYLRKYWEVQVEIGESVQGWAYWTWKAENADEWSYQKGLEGGWIPQNPDQRLYPGLCSNSTSGKR